ncbi:hypothetical protein ACFUVV_23015 [Streptomyces sp. NPDC057376]|uniref:hypothetical protein n=1 Tax=Streptomyces sp. NPDC057376 TaxID=3346110 RepID=UPI0026D08A02
MSAGGGAKGPRHYDWAAIDLLPEAVAGVYRLLIRRNRTTGELACYRCLSPHPVPIGTLVRVAGMRWRIEETFQAGKGLAGLDEHQVRRYTPWLRWVTLAMLAHAFLAVVRAREHRDHPVPDGLIALACNEIQRLFATPNNAARQPTRTPSALAPMAPPASSPGPHMPLPPPHNHTMKIHNHGWSISRPPPGSSGLGGSHRGRA